MNTIKTRKKSLLAVKTIVSCLLSLSIVNGIFAQTSDLDQEKTELDFTQPFTKTGSIMSFKEEKVTFLKDKKGKKFVLKHHRGSEYAIHEAIATKIGMSVEIPINHVEIFSKENPRVKNYSNNKITTLHTHVPGYPIYKMTEYDEIDIKGGIEYANNLKSITKNPDLCDIVVLDIFVNNPDRHSGNFFVQQQFIEYPKYTIDIEQNGGNLFADEAGRIVSEQFHAIDMDYAYRNIMELSEKEFNLTEDKLLKCLLSSHLLATRACDFLEELEDRNQQLSSKEIKALKRVNETLGKLIDKYPAERQYSEWMQIAEKVNYQYCPTKKENIQIALEYNMHEVKRLYTKINTIVTK